MWKLWNFSKLIAIFNTTRMQSHKSAKTTLLSCVCVYLYIYVYIFIYVYKLSNEVEQHEVKIKSIFELFKKEKEKRRRDHSSWKKEIWKALYNSSKRVRCFIYCKP